MKKIGRYTILERIGKGGMGTVYRALDSVLRREVALKTHAVSSEPDIHGVERFFREARVIASLQHANIVTVFDLGQDRDKVFIAMELLEGDDLTAVMQSGEHITLEGKLRIVVAVTEALAHAHHREIVHRDIKPRNVFVTREGNVKLLDFGLAHIASSTLTGAGQIIGTPFYMSPEQVSGATIDPRSDIFSLGTLFYELLTDEVAFGGDNIQAIFERIVRHDPKPMREIVPAIPEELARIVSRMMAKPVDKRYPSTDDLLRDLLRFHRFLGQYKKQLRDEAKEASSELNALTDRHAELFSREGIPPASERLADALERDDLSYMSLVGLRDGAGLQLRRLEKLVDDAAKADALDQDRTLSIYESTWTGSSTRTSSDGERATQKIEAAKTHLALGHLAGSLRLVSEALRLAPDSRPAGELAEQVRIAIMNFVDQAAGVTPPKQLDVLVAALLAMDEKEGEKKILQETSRHDRKTIAGLTDVFLSGLSDAGER